MSEIERAITNWFALNARDLPWRKSNPWGVLVSEFMLQQTPVVRVTPKWHEWMERWPTPDALAAASPADVITAWGRLGYPRRALRLRDCATLIATEHNNQVPSDVATLLTLPGIGSYTAAAIASFAYEREALVLDVNIRRLFARLYDGTDLLTSAPSKKEIAERTELLPDKDAHTWAAATMELGALICTARSPQCEKCPVVSSCKWRAAGYPAAATKKRVQKWHGTDRQCRGTIIEALRNAPSLGAHEIDQLWSEKEQLNRALESLIKDQLITIWQERYRLPQ